jgi:hypothetical protein
MNQNYVLMKVEKIIVSAACSDRLWDESTGGSSSGKGFGGEIDLV